MLSIVELLSDETALPVVVTVMMLSSSLLSSPEYNEGRDSVSLHLSDMIEGGGVGFIDQIESYKSNVNKII